MQHHTTDHLRRPGESYRIDQAAARRLAVRTGELSACLRTREIYERVLVVCEGEKTEPNYFRSFPIRAGEVVDVRGLGMNTLSLVERAVEIRDKDGGYDESWVVFDRDSFEAEMFNAAVGLAKREGLKLAYSNEAFEIWYLLHFEYCDADLSRTTYGERLTKYLESEYRKNDPAMYGRLVGIQPEALRNAESLMSFHGEGCSPLDARPSTSVHKLVVRLNKLLRR